MLSQKSIEVNVRDHTDLRCGRVRLAVNETIAQIRPQILERLAMPLEDNRGEPISYTLCNESHVNQPYLQDSQRVGQVLVEGQTVRAIPQIIAGVQNDCEQ